MSIGLATLALLLAPAAPGSVPELASILQKHARPLMSDSRLPRRAEVAPCHGDQPTKLPFAFNADLNGDDRLDWAVMLIRVPAHSFQVVVLLAQNDGRYRPLVLETNAEGANDFCIVEVPPGRYRTARGK